MSATDLRDFVRDIPDFPRPGIVFRDITPLLLDPAALSAAVDELSHYAREREVELVAAAEARGFNLGGAVAEKIGAGFIPARKPGKLPAETSSVEYALEYGIDALHVHADALSGGARVLVHDDLLATGGTASATSPSAICSLFPKWPPNGTAISYPTNRSRSITSMAIWRVCGF